MDGVEPAEAVIGRQEGGPIEYVGVEGELVQPGKLPLRVGDGVGAAGKHRSHHLDACQRAGHSFVVAMESSLAIPMTSALCPSSTGRNCAVFIHSLLINRSRDLAARRRDHDGDRAGSETGEE